MIKHSLTDFFTPAKQGLAALIIGLTGIAASKLFSSGATQFSLAFTGIVIYTLFNCIISIFQLSFQKYVLQSWGVYVILVIILLLTARFVSGESIQAHREFIKILLSVSLFYIVLSVLVRFIRMMWEFAENDER